MKSVSIFVVLSVVALVASAKQTREERYKYHVARAAVYQARGLYPKALRHLRRAAHLMPKVAFVQCELGLVRFKIALSNHRKHKPKRARRNLLGAQGLFKRCFRMAGKSDSLNKGKLQRKARAGMRDCKRLLRLVR